jgi:hypothetical protein
MTAVEIVDGWRDDAIAKGVDWVRIGVKPDDLARYLEQLRVVRDALGVARPIGAA